MEIKEMFLDDALEYAKEKKSRLVWVGNEPVDYINEILGLAPGTMMQMQAYSIMAMNKEDAKAYKDCIFVCYHGNSSRYIAEMLKEKYDIESGSLRGGVTAIVGEIF